MTNSIARYLESLAPSLFLLAAVPCVAEDMKIKVDLTAPDAAAQWRFTDERATIVDGEVRLDGRVSPTYAFLKVPSFGDVSLSARYMVEPHEGVKAVGFVIGSTDSETYQFVHKDWRSAILCRCAPGNEWIEIKRSAAAHEPGKWYAARLERRGKRLSVRFDNQLLFEAEDSHGQVGLVGFYASQTIAHVKDVEVIGVEAKMAGAWRVLPRMWVHVCTDAGAGGYEAFPDVCRMADGRLICVFYAGYGHVAMPNAQLPKGGRISYCISSDEGRTWSPARTLFDGPYDDRDPSIVQLKDGRLICNFFTLKPRPGGSPAWDGLGSWMVTSRDGGKTWDTEPQCISKDYYCSAPIRELPDGRLMLGLYAETKETSWGAVTISGDGGKTWCKPIDIPNGGMRLDAETDVIPLKDGSIFAALRGAQISAWSVSKDGGKTWSVAKQFGFPGHCHYLHRAPGGIILMAHRLPNTSLHYSLDEGKTWSPNVQVDTVGGAYPSMVTLKDGTILIVYYEEGAGSSIRAKRFRATPKGIEWLPIGADQ
jgi:sialidase-1